MEFDSLQLNTRLSTHLINSTAQQPVDNELVETALSTHITSAVFKNLLDYVEASAKSIK